jgi:hypothetical protein
MLIAELLPGTFLTRKFDMGRGRPRPTRPRPNCGRLRGITPAILASSKAFGGVSSNPTQWRTGRGGGGPTNVHNDNSISVTNNGVGNASMYDSTTTLQHMNNADAVGRYNPSPLPAGPWKAQVKGIPGVHGQPRTNTFHQFVECLQGIGPAGHDS